ncbi:unnamed protein product [Rotaria sp. Silwood1]|nr:unnamed protein product [Rotaria sp. Silwood1]CAF5026973.1 unnamed protein product [Rotaria sp. Silwood1]
MASSQSSTISSGRLSQLNETANPHYACYWLDSCGGHHELNQCSRWRAELRGKLGIYYSQNGKYTTFDYDHRSGVNLKHNRTECTTMHLLIYTIRSNGETEILFGLSNRRNKHSEANRRSLLSFPTSKPRKRNEDGEQIARRAFKWIADQIDIPENGLKPRFLFQNANVVYPLHLNNEQADIFTENFTPNEELLSLHWVSLRLVLERLLEWTNYLTSEATANELAQQRDINPIGIHLGEHELWSVTTTCLMCIREHVPGGFETFLQV